jgi:adenylate cyclase
MSIDEIVLQTSSLVVEIEALKKEIRDLKSINKVLVSKLKEKETEVAKLNKLLIKEKDFETSTSKRFNMVTILFSSIRGFSNLSGNDMANNLVDELDQFYYFFDNVVKKHNVKKVKSIGDTYMCAGGIPKKNRTNPIEVILAALEIQQYMINRQAEASLKNEHIWSLTLGIHTGSVTASISGKKKISYELKGDSANIVSRIEAASRPGIVTISAMTHEFVREFFECEYIGSLPVKYIGDIAMYEVKGLQEKFSDDPLKLIPNKAFQIRFGHVRYDDLEEYILNRLENELSKSLYYHNVKHTMDVCIGVEIIGTSEGVNEEELLLLKTAGLFHDMGQIIQSKGHEEISCNYVREILPQYDYNQEQIDAICGIIMATQLPPNPQTKLERIICDADLDYLGRTDFIPVSDTLYKELSEQNIINDKNTWNKLQVSFISNHQYFTDFAKNNREVNKQNQIERLKNLIS